MDHTSNLINYKEDIMYAKLSEETIVSQPCCPPTKVLNYVRRPRRDETQRSPEKL